MSAEFVIENVNGIEQLRVGLPDAGVVVVRGPNGAGKTSAINALRAACGGDAVAEPTDGSDRGYVRCTGGLTLTVGRQRRLNGEPTVQLVDVGPLGTLIDPPVKGEQPRAKARLKALLELVPLPADEHATAELCGGDEQLAREFAGGHWPDALALAERVRQEAYHRARLLEQERDEQRGREAAAEAVVAQLAGVPAKVGAVADCQRDLDQAIRDADRAAIQAKARADLEAQQEQVRAELGERPDVAAARAAADKVRKELADVELRIAVLRDQLRHAEQLVAAREAEHDRWTRARAILDKPVEGPTAEEASRLDAVVASARRALEMARQGERRDIELRNAATAKDAAERAGDAALRMRAIGGGTTDVLAGLLLRAGLGGISIEDGRLQVALNDGVPRDFESRLSFGQKVRTALRIALHAHRRRGDQPVLLALEPEFWLALDGAHRAEVHAAACELGVIVVCEQPDDGDLRVEPMN